MGPLTRQQLLEHLGMRHCSDYSDQPQLEDYMAALPFLMVDSPYSGDKYSLFHVYEKRKEGRDACPIQGCDFRLSFGQPAMECHISGHDLLDRMKSHKGIQQLLPEYNYLRGLIICPMCQNEVCGCCDSYSRGFEHFNVDHSREERLSSAGMLELCQAVAAAGAFPFSRLYTYIEEWKEATRKGLGIMAAK